MSTMEIILIVCACCVPLLAIMFLLPKKKKVAESKPVEEKKEEPKSVEEIKPEAKDDLQAEIKDFETYIREQRETTSKQEALEEPTDVKTLPYKEEVIEDTDIQPIEKDTVEETKRELDNLSPELKAMLLAGVLDKKDFDE